MNRLIETVVSTASAFTVVGVVATIDQQVRDRMSDLFTGQPLLELSLAGAYTHRVARVVTETATSYSTEHTPLVFFSVGALVLVVLMFRT
jgi:hypothetical protein